MRPTVRAFFAVAAVVGADTASTAPDNSEASALSAALDLNDQCAAAKEQCALQALQVRGKKVSAVGGQALSQGDTDAAAVASAAAHRDATDQPPEAEAQAPSSVGADDLASGPVWHYALDCWHSCGKAGYCSHYCGPGNACCRYNRPSDPPECRGVRWWPTYFTHTCVKPSVPPPTTPPTTTAAPQAVEAPGTVVGPSSQGSAQCTALDVPANAACKKAVSFAASDGKYDPRASGWYTGMKDITGVNYVNATVGDFQRLFFCAPPGGTPCGTPPCRCSKPPCDSCFGGAPPRPKRAGCDGGSTSIECKPPVTPLDYKGMAWPTMSVPGTGEMHVFAIGDWGGMDGSLNPAEGRPPIVAYNWGKRPGPSVFPRSRWNKYHSVELCSHTQFVACYESHGGNCTPSCGYVEGVDDKAQILVAEAMKQRAASNKPQFFLNVGDNFYWGGIEKTCGTTPMDQLSYTAHHQFDQIYERVYTGQGLEGKPWFSVLGNHDWGGRQFNNGWDQQIAYTWASTRWVMPAPFYSATMDFPDQGFSMEVLFIDTNHMDAHANGEDAEHNLCGPHNPPNANCAKIGGPSSIETCPGFFQSLWAEQKPWVEKKLASSKADWQVIVTHFPCGHEQYWYRDLHQRLGLDLLVTGHRHDQELWDPAYPMNQMGGLTCFVTGGGGGISSEATPNPMDKRDWFGEGEYGFYDLTVSKTAIKIESINWDGKVLKSHVVGAHGGNAAPSWQWWGR